MTEKKRSSSSSCLNQISASSHFLNLAGQNITLDGVRALTAVLEKQKAVVVNLSKNCLCPEGIATLANILRKQTTVTTLYLCENNLTDESSKPLAHLISSCSLSHLNISSNSLGEETAKAIAGALSVSKTIEKLYLQGNNIGDEGALAIARVVKNKPLKVLNLADNNISSRTANEIKNLCSSVSSLILASDPLSVKSSSSSATNVNTRATGTEVRSQKPEPLSQVEKNIPLGKRKPSSKKMNDKGTENSESVLEITRPSCSCGCTTCTAHNNFLMKKLLQTQESNLETKQQLQQTKDQLQQLQLALAASYELLSAYQTKKVQK